MAWRPNPNDRDSWTTVGSGLAVVGLGGVAAWHSAVVPVCVFGAVGFIGIYTAFMPLMGLPPWPRPGPSTQNQTPGEQQASGASSARQPVEDLFPLAVARKSTLLEATEKSDAFRDLKYHLQEGRRLAGRLDRGETCEVARDKDYVYDWARATWRDLDHHRPTLAREFFGNKCPYGHYQSDFSAAYGIEVDRIGRRAYLADRIATLTRAVEAS
jgi:hypothetical protein